MDSSEFAFLAASTPDQLMGELEKFITFWLGPRRAEYGEPDESSGEFAKIVERLAEAAAEAEAGL